MTSRRSEKLSWTLGWCGSFVWVLILAAVGVVGEATEERVVIEDVPEAVRDLFEAEVFVVERMAHEVLAGVEAKGARAGECESRHTRSPARASTKTLRRLERQGHAA